MIKNLEQLATKYQKIAEFAIQLKQENSLLYKQIDNLQQQLTLLIEDKLQLEHKNNFLTHQLSHTKQNLLAIIDSVHWEEESNFSGNHSKDTNGLYSTNSNLSFAAAAAAAAIGNEENLLPPQKIIENISDLSQAVSELENIQDKILHDVINSEQNNEKINSNLDDIEEQAIEKKHSIYVEEDKKEYQEKVHYGVIRS